MKARLPRFFRTRIILSILLLVVMLSLGGAALGFKNSFDPGPVWAAHFNDEPIQGYESHASFEKECTHCHAPVRCLSANLCQDCHQSIAKERAEAEGLHALLPGTDKCQNCHVEHQGRDAAICDVPFANLNHEQLTGFCLARHETNYDGSTLTCQQCHAEGRCTAEALNCNDCHSDHDPSYMGEHVAQFGEDCIGCHDGQDRMVDLDHSQVFALEGGHEQADCEDCHAGQTFASTARGCADCHPEPAVHASLFGLDCARCHSAAAWTPAQLTEHPFLLDHGGQGQLECAVCHTDRFVEYTCYGCHDHQPEEMQAKHTQEGVAEFEACADCHPSGRKGEAARGG